MGLVAPTPILNLPVATGVDNTYWVPTASTNGSPTERVNVSVLSGAQGELNSISRTQGAVLFRGADLWEVLDPGTAGYVLSTQGSNADPQWIPGTSGSVTSVGLSLPTSLFLVSGSPVTSTGTLTGDLVAQSANKIFAGPTTGSDAVPTFRSLVNADISETGAALTKTDDANVTATLSGSPTTALVNATNIALGWTGLLGLSRGGTNADLSATGGAGQYLKQSSAGAAVTVGTISASDIASGAALTKTDDTNVTITLGGSPSTALLAATSLTLGWAGSLAVGRGGTGQTTLTNHGVVLGQGTSGVAVTAAGTSGQWLQSGGSSADPGWATLPGPTIQIFTSSGTWTKPTGCVKIVATIIGGGGGGGGVQIPSGAFCGGGGGGAGGTGITVMDVTSISSLSVTVGAAGTAGDGTTTGGPGGTGGTSQLGTSGANGQATGGIGGNGRSTAQGGSSLNAGGNGGVASNCTINGGGSPGGFGMSFSATNGQISGVGGDSLYGGGGASIRPSGSSVGNNGTAGSGYGSGGSGAAVTNSTTNTTGGAGAPGIVIIEEYYA